MKNKIVKHFYVKETKINSKGEAPIYLRITVNGERAEISTDRRVNPDNWDKSAERVAGRSEPSRAINVALDNLTGKVEKYFSNLWSDGKRIAKMMPDFPKLVICKKCDQFYWVKDAKKVTDGANSAEHKENLSEAEFIEFPTFYQYFKALESIDDEKFIRVSIWRSFNDYFRNKQEGQITPEMEQLNNENLAALLKILDESDNNELLMKAEVYRNLMQFDASFKLLNKVKDPNLDWVKEKLLAEINNLNNKVIQLY